MADIVCLPYVTGEAGLCSHAIQNATLVLFLTHVLEVGDWQ